MDILFFIILILLLCTAIFLVYWFFRGQKGRIALARPIESRVDEYLDRRFQSMVEEWGLVSHARLTRFREQHTGEIEQDEARLAELKNYETAMKSTLASLEARLVTLEKEIAEKDRGSR